MKRFLMSAALAGAVSVLGAAPSSAASFTIDFDVEFSGATAPVGTPPWLTATFEDTVADTVRLTVTQFLTGSEFVSELAFNLDPALDPTALVFTPVSGHVPTSFVTGVDSNQADGGGKYDITINMDTAPPGDRFTSGSVPMVIDITGFVGLDALDFQFIAAPGGGNAPYQGAAHVQGIGANGNDSGWIGGTDDGDGSGDDDDAVPEPALLSLLGIGLAGAAYKVRRRA